MFNFIINPGNRTKLDKDAPYKFLFLDYESKEQTIVSLPTQLCLIPYFKQIINNDSALTEFTPEFTTKFKTGTFDNGKYSYTFEELAGNKIHLKITNQPAQPSTGGLACITQRIRRPLLREREKCPHPR